MKLKPGLGTFKAIQPGNGSGFSSGSCKKPLLGVFMSVWSPNNINAFPRTSSLYWHGNV